MLAWGVGMERLHLQEASLACIVVRAKKHIAKVLLLLIAWPVMVIAGFRKGSHHIPSTSEFIILCSGGCLFVLGYLMFFLLRMSRTYIQLHNDKIMVRGISGWVQERNFEVHYADIAGVSYGLEIPEDASVSYCEYGRHGRDVAVDKTHHQITEGRLTILLKDGKREIIEMLHCVFSVEQICKMLTELANKGFYVSGFVNGEIWNG